MKIKRVRSEIECDACGKKFMQTRWWQVYCSEECKKMLEKTAKATLKKVLPELEYLRSRVKELENNALAHLEGPIKVTLGGFEEKKLKDGTKIPSRFAYDDDNQETNYE